MGRQREASSTNRRTSTYQNDDNVSWEYLSGWGWGDADDPTAPYVEAHFHPTNEATIQGDRGDNDRFTVGGGGGTSDKHSNNTTRTLHWKQTRLPQVVRRRSRSIPHPWPHNPMHQTTWNTQGWRLPSAYGEWDSRPQKSRS